MSTNYNYSTEESLLRLQMKFDKALLRRNDIPVTKQQCQIPVPWLKTIISDLRELLILRIRDTPVRREPDNTPALDYDVDYDFPDNFLDPPTRAKAKPKRKSIRS